MLKSKKRVDDSIYTCLSIYIFDKFIARLDDFKACDCSGKISYIAPKDIVFYFDEDEYNLLCEVKNGKQKANKC